MRSPVGGFPVLWLSLLAGLVLAGAGCDLGQTGIDPPMDQIFWPAGLAIDPHGNWLYVVNSNNDLRFNAGTLIAIDLQQAKRDQAGPPAETGLSSWTECNTTHFTDDTAAATLDGTSDDYCCFDLLRPHVLNCNERAYVQADTTVQIGSFGGEAAIQNKDPNDPESAHRIFMIVRAEPSITFVDVTHPDGEGSVHMRCNGARSDPDPLLVNPFCDDNWRVRRPSGAAITDNVLPEEPHAMALDQELGILYVGHLTITSAGQTVGGGISTIDIGQQDPNQPARGLLDPSAPNVINSIARIVFPTSTVQGVTALTLSDPNDPNNPGGVLYAVARASADITGMLLQCQAVGQHCDASDPTSRDLSLVPGEQIVSSAFLPSGTDVRGFLLSPDGKQAYVLHRNTPESSTSSDPAALVVLDRQLNQTGEPANTPSAILEVCSGATRMQFAPAGQGNLLYITCFEGGQIYVVDPQAPRVVAIIEAGNGPTALTFSPTDPNVAFAASYADNDVSVIDLEPGSPTEYMVVQRIGFPHADTTQ